MGLVIIKNVLQKVPDSQGGLIEHQTVFHLNILS